MLARCPACNVRYETTQEVAMANEPCWGCWQLGFRPDGLRGVIQPDPDTTLLANFDRTVERRTTHPRKDTMDTTTAPAIPAEISSRFPDVDIADGEIYAGLSRDPNTGAWHHLVLLPATTDKNLTWQEAIDWARSVGGELPTRFESALLYANVRDQINTDYWYWTATQHAGEPSWAWYQYFGSGYQDTNLKASRDLARAVRRVPV